MSVGEAFYPDDGSDAEQLLAEADRRMYKSKHSNKAARSSGIHLLPRGHFEPPEHLENLAAAAVGPIPVN